MTCEHCTLQVLEYMSSHSAPCFYYHCADLAIQGSPVACGDGTLQAGEECDDGNTASGDGCSWVCAVESPDATPTPAACGLVADPKLTIGKLSSPPGDDTLSFKGTVSVPAASAASLDPVANGIRLQIAGGAGTVVDVTAPPGMGWEAMGADRAGRTAATRRRVASTESSFRSAPASPRVWSRSRCALTVSLRTSRRELHR